MHNIRTLVPFSPVSVCAGFVATLLVTYLLLIAIVMSYAVLTIQFSQSERNDEATVATLESQYLVALTTITTTDYTAEGYAQPIAVLFVPTQPVALR